jgi:hypothetical protein
MRDLQVQRHLGTQLVDQPSTEPPDLTDTVVLARNQRHSNLEPDVVELRKIGKGGQDWGDVAIAMFRMEALPEPEQFDTRGIDVPIQLGPRLRTDIAAAQRESSSRRRSRRGPPRSRTRASQVAP